MKKADLDLRGQTSGQLKTFCPLCHASRKKQHDRSLQVNLDTGGYTCWNCKAAGYLEDVISSPFVAKQKKEYKVPDEKSVGTVEPDPEVLAYFRGRGISEDTLKAWKISYGPSFGVYDYAAPKTRDGKTPLKRDADGIPIFLRGIQFPFLEDGKRVNVKYLRPREWAEDGERMFRSFTGGKPIPFGLDNASTRIVIVEGEIDALSVYEAGIHEVWSLPNGAKSFDWLELDGVVARMLNASEIFVAVDADSDGRECREELIRRLSRLVGPEKISVVYWPADCKDANDVLVKYGPERLRELVEDEARPVPVDGISEIDEFIPEYLEYYVDGVPKGLSLEIGGLDEIYRVMPGMLTVITGVTNYGKSEFMDEVIRKLIDLHGWKFGLYTPENSPLPMHMMKIAEKHIGKPFDRTKLGAMSQDEAIAAAEWMKENIWYINPKNTSYSVDEIIERANVLIYRKGIKGLLIDPWNYVRKDFNGLREDQYINEQMQKLAVFCRSTGVHIWLTVHPRTLKRDKDDKIVVPTVHELSGGSKFGDNADFVLAVHRDPTMAFQTGIHEVTIINQKSRYRPAATQGKHVLIWNPFNGRFNDDTTAESALAGVNNGVGTEYEWSEADDEAF